MNASAAPEPEYFWFKNEMQCADAKVTVRSYCEATTPGEGTVHVNSKYAEQQLLIESPGKKKVRRNLLEHKRRVYLVAWRLTCAKSGDTWFKLDYLHLTNTVIDPDQE